MGIKEEYERGGIFMRYIDNQSPNQILYLINTK